MITLIVGGRNAGKYEYLLSLGYQPHDIGKDFSSAALYKLNDLVKELLSENIEVVEFISDKLKDTSDITIVCDEVGCGVVPIYKFDRDYREAVGRASLHIARKADVVERIYCGLSTRIKG